MLWTLFSGPRKHIRHHVSQESEVFTLISMPSWESFIGSNIFVEGVKVKLIYLASSYGKKYSCISAGYAPAR
jgi:hypothetical protein